MVAQSLGNDLDANASSTLAITHDVHYVTGLPSNTVTFNTLTPPSPEFAGIVTLIHKSGSSGISWNTSGNIARSGALSDNSAIQFFYNPSTSKWHPIAI